MEKYRGEKDIFQIDFTDRLNTGETISSATVVVQRAVLYAWVDVSDIVEDVVVGSGNKLVQFTLVKAPTTSAQPAGAYRVVANAVTSGGRDLEGVVDLTIKE